MGAWAAVGSVAAQTGGDMLSSAASHTMALRRQRQAQGFEANMFQNRYSMTVADLKNAGLNPMLAYTNGPGNAPASSAAGAAPGSAGTDAINAYNQTRLATAQMALLKAQEQKTVAEANLTSKKSDIADPMAIGFKALSDAIQGYFGNSAKRQKDAQSVGGILKKGTMNLWEILKKQWQKQIPAPKTK